MIVRSLFLLRSARFVFSLSRRNRGYSVMSPVLPMSDIKKANIMNINPSCNSTFIIHIYHTVRNFLSDFTKFV